MKRPGGFDDDSREEASSEPARRESRVRERKIRGLKPHDRIGSAHPASTDEAREDPSAGAMAPTRQAEPLAEPPLMPRARAVIEGAGSDAVEGRVVELSELIEREQSEAVEPAATGRPGENRVRSAERALARARSSVRRRERRETKRFTTHLRRRRRNWLIAVGAVLALAAFVAIGSLSPLMSVRDVQIAGASRVSVDRLETALARFDGMPLTLVSEREVHRALEPFPLIQRYSIERIPPHTLRIRIEEREPVIAIEKEDRYELLDPAGVLVAVADEIPAGVALAEGSAAEPSTPGFAAAGAVVRDLPDDLREQLAAVAASSAQDVELTLGDGTAVVWGEAVDSQEKSVVLRAMLKAVPGASMIDVSAPETPVFE